MQELAVQISDLKSEGGELIEELADMLREKTDAEVETVADEIVVRGEGKSVSKSYIRVLLRKFLHRHELKEYFRVLGSRENSLIVKERKASQKE